MSRIRTLSELDSAAVSDFGAKATTLARLRRAGLPVPDGFVVAAGALTEQLERIGAPPRAPGADDIARLRAEPLTGELRRELEHAHRRLMTSSLVPRCTTVRSSGIAEDGDTTSFAGQHATYYYVGPATLEQAVRDCWASLYSEAARHYRAHVAPGAPFGMAVLVQVMVQAEASGVIFTKDPMDGGTLVVESTWGLGAALVDGRVTPDRFKLDRGSLELTERRIATKRFKVAENLEAPDAARLDPVPSHLCRAASIKDDVVRDLAGAALRSEAILGSPQDVEWAIAGDRIWILQSRPVTVRPATSPHYLEGRWVVFKPLIENFTEPMTPLTIDLVRRLLPPFGRFIDGRYYVSYDAARRLLPLDMTDAERVDLLLFRSQRTDYPVAWRRLPVALGAYLAAYLTAGVFMARTRHLEAVMLDDFRATAEAVLADSSLDPPAMLERLFHGPHPFAPVQHYPFQINVSSVRYFFLLAGLRRLIGDAAGENLEPLIADLTAGNRDMISARMVHELQALGATAARNPALRRAVAERDVAELLPRLAQSPHNAFAIAFNGFLKRFGHRGPRELELGAPRWRDDPMLVLALLEPPRAEAPAANAPDRALAAETRLAEVLPSRFARYLARYLIRRIRYYATLRENSRHYHAMAFATVRARILALEQVLLDRRALRCADDIFFLTWNEVAALTAERLTWHDVEARIHRRRRRHLAAGEQLPPATINVLPRGHDGDPAGLRGQCASPGLAEGTARVVFDPAADAPLKSGEILVAPYTDPSWTPLFCRSAAVVVEVGSYLSHAGTLARELGIPCIVDVADCTRRITSGQRLRLDATRGTIELAGEDGA